MAGGADSGGLGGGRSGSATESSGFVTGVLSPIMKAVGLGIAARGGALGPMLASGSDFIQQAHEERLKQDVWSNVMPGLLAGVTRSREIPGMPATPDTVGPAGPPREDPMGEAMIPGEPGPVIPGRPATAAVTRTWETEPMLHEAMSRLQGTPPMTRSMAVRELVRMRLPTSVETPAHITDEVQRQRALTDYGTQRQAQLADYARQQQDRIAEEERRRRQAQAEEARKGPIYGRGLAPGATPEEQGAAAAAGLTVPAPPAQTRVEFTPDGRKRTIDTRTNRVLTDEPIRTPAQDATIASMPQFAQEFEAAVRQGGYTAQEAQIGRQLLARARITGDLEPFVKFAENAAKLRSAERRSAVRASGAGAGAPSETLTTTQTEVPGGPIWRKEERQGLENILGTFMEARFPEGFKRPTGPVKMPDGVALPPERYMQEVKRAIEREFLDQHGVQVSVEYVKPGRLGFGGGWKIVRAWEAPRVKGSTTTRRKGPPTPLPKDDED